MFNRKAKPIRIIGVPDNQRPDKWSSTVSELIVTFCCASVGERRKFCIPQLLRLCMFSRCGSQAIFWPPVISVSPGWCMRVSVLATEPINKEQLEWLNTMDELKANEPRRLTYTINPSFSIPSKFLHYCLNATDPYSHYIFIFRISGDCLVSFFYITRA